MASSSKSGEEVREVDGGHDSLLAQKIDTIMHKVKFDMWNHRRRPVEDPDLWMREYLAFGDTAAWGLVEKLCWKEAKVIGCHTSQDRKFLTDVLVRLYECVREIVDEAD